MCVRIKKLVGDGHIRRAREAMIATLGVGLGALVLIWYETFSDQRLGLAFGFNSNGTTQ